MVVLKTTYQRKSAFITLILMSFLIFILFICGLKSIETPEEYGIAINFGTSEVGSGEPKLNKTIASSDPETPSPQESKPTNQTDVIQEKVVTQDVEEAPVVEEKKEVEKILPKLIEKKKENVKTQKEEIITPPKPTKKTQNVLNNLFGKKSEGQTAESEGDDTVEGVKGAVTGDPSSKHYYGNNGSGGQGNYLLKGRKALSKPKKKPNCNEEGVVVVRIEVDNKGNVIKAVSGVKGTTNNSPCLLAPAKKAALATKWNADGNAPVKQIGFIRYKFILSE